MPKINVYLPDDLADAVREAGLPVSTICQRALEQAVQRLTTIRQAVLSDLDHEQLAERLPSCTPRALAVLTLAADRAKESGAATVTTGDLLHGILAEGQNLALVVLNAMDIAPGSLTAPGTPETGSDGDGLRFSRSAANVLESTVSEAVGFGHNYIGCEHLLIALAAEPDGAAGELLRSRGADGKAVRRAVAAALAGYVHRRANTAPGAGMAGLIATVRAEIAALVERVKRLEARRP